REGSSGFSPSLNDYIKRSYQKCKTDNDFKKCQASLTKTIQNAIKKGDLHTRDFSKFPLPYILSDETAQILVKVSDQEKNRREQRKDRFDLQSIDKSVSKTNIEELSKNIKIIVIIY